MEVEIVDLADTPELMDACVAWWFGQWGCQSGRTLEDGRQNFEAAMPIGRQAFTFVARRGGKPAGMASLRATNFKGRPDLTPWVTSVYVHPDHRRFGLARMLVPRVEAAAKRLGHTRLHLITEHAEALYAGLGWTTFDHVVGDYGPAVLMQKALSG